MPRPVFVALEGLDGTGKSTLAKLLAEALGAPLLRTPPGELASVRPAIDHALVESPVATQLFYAGTVALASLRVQEHLAAGRSVVVDRYWASTMAYGACRAQHVDLAGVAATLTPASLTVYLTVDEEARRERLAHRACTAADRDSLAQRERLAAAYERALAGPWSGPVMRLDTTRRSPARCVDAVLVALCAKRAA